VGKGGEGRGGEGKGVGGVVRVRGRVVSLVSGPRSGPQNLAPFPPSHLQVVDGVLRDGQVGVPLALLAGGGLDVEKRAGGVEEGGLALHDLGDGEAPLEPVLRVTGGDEVAVLVRLDTNDAALGLVRAVELGHLPGALDVARRREARRAAVGPERLDSVAPELVSLRLAEAGHVLVGVEGVDEPPGDAAVAVEGL
jgi:hypothetical protein